jgi:serine/threonine protein kinase
MGNLMDSFCCIDTNEILENTNFRKFSSSNNKENREDSYSGMATPSSELKSLPIMEMKTDNFITPKAKIKSLSNLPISTKNVIRKISGDPFDNYRIIKKLGQGTFGQVYKIMQLKTGNIRALKIIPKNNLRAGFTDKDITREINIMKNLDHPHIIKLYEFYKDAENYYLVNEFCTEGDLSEKMNKLKFLPEPIVKILMAQIFSAVLYLNNRGIIHGDLKLENILVDSYLDDGNIQTKNQSNFISSLIKDARNVQNYLKDLKLKRGNTTILNRKKLQENLKRFRNSGKKLFPKNSNKMYLYENQNNIITEETKECEFNNEERKNNFESDKEDEEEKANIFGFESNEENEIEEIPNNDSSDFSSSPEKNNII